MSSICFLCLSPILQLVSTAPKRRARGAAGVVAMCGIASRGRRGRGARAPRASRGCGGRGGSSRGSPAEVVDEGILAHDFVLHICDPVRRRISLPSSFATLLSELSPKGL